MHARLALVAAGLLAAATLAQAAGQVDVRFKPADQLSDVGRGVDGERAVQTLTEHFQALAARLPDGQRLSIEVLDVDLAGELRWTRRGSELRVLNGGADWPSMQLRWKLEAGDRTLSSQDERISDPGYLQQSSGLRTGPLPYEARMVDRWFDARFGGRATAAR